MNFFSNIQPYLNLVGISTWQTLIMVFFSTLFALIIGFPLGVLLNCTNKYGITPKPVFNSVLSRIIDVLRSFPFVILMIVLLPFTRLVLGTAIGTTATIIPLSIAAAPFVARITETALNEVDPGVVQAARAMGSTNFQIIWKVLIPEATPSVVSGITLTIINLISYSAMAGTLGGGGLGDLAIRYGYQRFNTTIMIASVVVIIIMVALIQFFGTKISNRMMSKR
ncbi:MAG: ABC transporter permease [Treponema sp.]|nr:ABC transporter permease [Candidatus Treponema equifaecale]